MFRVNNRFESQPATPDLPAQRPLWVAPRVPALIFLWPLVASFCLMPNPDNRELRVHFSLSVYIYPKDCNHHTAVITGDRWQEGLSHKAVVRQRRLH